MENVRKIVREELAKALLQLRESTAFAKNDEQIIYNFDAGRTFGINKLAKDIRGLDMYYMSSYFPNSEMKETWMFETETNYGGSQIIEIVHQVGHDYKSQWKLNIAETDRYSSEPHIIATSGTVEGYDKFIEKVNSTLEKTIDTGLL
jgi:hypothetical protein